jgi:hypothetical protein
VRAGIDLAHRIIDQLLDLLGGGSRTLRQRAHFGGHHGKAASLLAGAGRFHGGVQGQDIGLEGDAVDDADDVHDLARGGIDGSHGLHHLAHHLAALLATSERRGQLVGVRALAAFCLTVRSALPWRGGFFQRAGLLLGAVGQVHVAAGDFIDRGLDGGRRALDALRSHDQLVAHVGDGRHQAVLVAAAGADGGGSPAILRAISAASAGSPPMARKMLRETARR